MSDGQGGPKPPKAIDAPDVAAMRASGLFAQPVVHRYVWSQEYTSEEYLALLSTYSGHVATTPGRHRPARGVADRHRHAARVRAS